MGIFSNNKKLCPICGAPTPRILPVKIEGIPICSDCGIKGDLPADMLNQITLEEFRQCMERYDENQALRDMFSETSRHDFGFFENSLRLDNSHRLFRIKDGIGAWAMEPSNLKSFRILEDETTLFEGDQNELRCFHSDVPRRVKELAPQITQFFMQHQMFESMMEMERRREERERARNKDQDYQPSYSNYTPEPAFDAPTPVKKFYVELTLDHPYWGGFRGKQGAPDFDRYNPSIEAYLKEYEEKVEELRQMALNLMNIMNPEAQIIEEKYDIPEGDDAIEEIQKYKALLDSGVITEEEFTAKKRQILGI